MRLILASLVVIGLWCGAQAVTMMCVGRAMLGAMSSCQVMQKANQISRHVTKIKISAARSNTEGFQSGYESLVEDGYGLVDCLFNKAANSCGRLSSDDRLVTRLASQMARKCWYKKDNLICRGKNTAERKLMTKGILCAAETGDTKEYMDQCFSQLKDKFPWDKMIKAVRKNGWKQTKDMTFCDEDGKQANQCLTLYGLIKDQCGATLANDFYRITVRKSCGENATPPEELAFTYERD